MNRRALGLMVLGLGLLFSLPILAKPLSLQGQTANAGPSPGNSDEEVTGPYDVVKDWPKPLCALFPEEKGWTWGSTQSIYAQNPNRIFISMRGELPSIRGSENLGRVGSALGETSQLAEAMNIEWPGR